MSDNKNSDSGLDFAWRVHDALDSWTGKVDVKASIALALESAVFGFVVALSEHGERFASLSGSRLNWYHIGVGLLLFSVATSLAVVFPQLRRCKSKREWRDNVIYFGHLRRWEPSELAARLRDSGLAEEQLARQLVAMSKIAWRKHSWLQWSLFSLAAGSACLIIVAIAG